MKKFKSVFMLVAVILIAAGAAFATNAAKNTGNLIVPGYLYDESLGYCDEKRNDCSTTGTDYCTWFDANEDPHILSNYVNDTSCEIPLYEPD